MAESELKRIFYFIGCCKPISWFAKGANLPWRIVDMLWSLKQGSEDSIMLSTSAKHSSQGREGEATNQLIAFSFKSAKIWQKTWKSYLNLEVTFSSCSSIKKCSLKPFALRAYKDLEFLTLDVAAAHVLNLLLGNSTQDKRLVLIIIQPLSPICKAIDYQIWASLRLIWTTLLSVCRKLRNLTSSSVLRLGIALRIKELSCSKPEISSDRLGMSQLLDY